MVKRSRRHLLKLSAVACAAAVGLSARADLKSSSNDRQVRLDNGQHRDEDRRPHGMVRLPTGQFVTPTALEGSSQQYLNPGLAAYPDSSLVKPCARSSALMAGCSRS